MPDFTGFSFGEMRRIWGNLGCRRNHFTLPFVEVSYTYCERLTNIYFRVRWRLFRSGSPPPVHFFQRSEQGEGYHFEIISIVLESKYLLINFVGFQCIFSNKSSMQRLLSYEGRSDTSYIYTG